MRINMLVTAAGMVAVLACGGPTPAPSASSATTAATTTSAGTTSTAGAAAPKVAASAAPVTADVCTLITADEVGRVMSATGVKTEPLTGDPSYCSYRDGAGALIAATSHLRQGSAAAYGAWAGSAKPVPGLGEKAQWVPSTATLMITKGGSVFSITAGSGRMAEAERQDLAQKLGALGAPRQ